MRPDLIWLTRSEHEGIAPIARKGFAAELYNGKRALIRRSNLWLHVKLQARYATAKLSTADF